MTKQHGNPLLIVDDSPLPLEMNNMAPVQWEKVLRREVALDTKRILLK